MFPARPSVRSGSCRSLREPGSLAPCKASRSTLSQPVAASLTGYNDVYRVRAGPYRVLYSVNTGTLIVIVLKVGHRRHMYR